MWDALQVAQAYFDAWNRHDAAGIVATFAEGGMYTDPLAQGLSGEAIAAYAQGLWGAFPDLLFEIVGQTLVDDGQVAAQWLMKGTNTGPFQGLPPSGRSVRLPGADFLTIAGDKIRSVQGYFDAGEVPRQLGLQILVQPYTLGPYQFGYAVSVQSGKKNKPGTFSITVLHARSETEMEQVRDYSRRIATEMLAMPEFIGWTGIIIGDRMMTVTAWDEPQSPRRLIREGTHVQAMQKFFGPEIATSGYTSVWIPERFNATWVRCTQCGRMADYRRANGRCTCGQALPEPPPYW
jgi:steroid delta-isomerase-like uncharacterized protein